MLWIKLLKKLITLINSDVSPNQIAGGVALGSIIGFTPFTCLHNFVVLFLIFLLNVNMAAAFFSAALFSFFALFTDPIANKIGYALLSNNASLTPLWTQLYNMPVIPLTRFNNTVVMGSLVISVAAFIPVFFFSAWFIKYYRATLRDKVKNSKIFKILHLSKVYEIYDKYK